MKLFSRQVLQGFVVKTMAYLHKGKETVEISHPLGRVWEAISKALTSLEWKVEEIEDMRHHVKVKTKAGFMSYSSVLVIDAVLVDEKTTRVSVVAETPVTTITSLTDFGRARDRVELFINELAKQLG